MNCLQRPFLLSYVQVVAPCQFAPPHRAMALGCQASIFGFVLSYDQHSSSASLNILNIRAVWLVSASRGRVIRDVVRLRPATGYFGNGVLRRGLVDGVGDPCVPEGLDLGAVVDESGQPASPSSSISSECGDALGRTGRSRASCSPPIAFALSTIDISNLLGRSYRVWFGGHTRQLICPILVVLVAELIRADQGAGLRVACSASATVKSLCIFRAHHTDVLLWRVEGQSSCGSRQEIERGSTYLELVPVFLQLNASAETQADGSGDTYLEADPADVAKCPADGRHLGCCSMGVNL